MFPFVCFRYVKNPPPLEVVKLQESKYPLYVTRFKSVHFYERSCLMGNIFR